MKTYVFVDLETTGLDPQNDRIVEVAWMYADAKLHRLTPTSFAVVKPVGDALQRINSTPEVLAMHTKTGLLDELQVKYNDLPLLQTVESSIVEELDAIEASYQKFKAGLSPEELLDPAISNRMEFQIAGKNVYFDKAFIDRYMPRLSARLSHRTLDETSLKNMAEAIGVGINLVPESQSVQGLTQHRAGYDVEMTFTTVRFVLDQFRVIAQSEEYRQGLEASYVIASDDGEFARLDIGTEIENDLRKLQQGEQ